MTRLETLDTGNRLMSRIFMILRAITRRKKANAPSFKKDLGRSLNRRLKARKRKPSKTRRRRRR
jgi:hypothetical protein